MILRSHQLRKDFDLTPGRITIGRRADRDITLPQESVSGKHAEVEMEDGVARVRDTSRNGTRLNGEQISEFIWTTLRPSDVIEICGVDFRLLPSGTDPDDLSSCVVDLNDSRAPFLDPGSKSISLSKSHLDGTKEYARLKTMLAITTSLRDLLQTDQVLERAVEMLFEIMPTIDRAAIGFLEDSGAFAPKWWRVREGDPDRVIQVSNTIVQYVASTSAAVASPDAIKDFEGAESIAASSMRSVMAAPLIDNNENVFGLIHVDASLPGVFTELDLEVLAAVAIQIGMAVTVSRLHTVALNDALLRRDVAQAREVQKEILPAGPPQVPGYDLTGFYRPAREIGGDYIDYVWLPDGNLAIVLGDVVGKGVPAALTMVRLVTETRACLEVSRTPAEIVTRLNDRFKNNFITFVILVLDPDSETITFCNAGQETPMYRRANGAVETIGFEESGCPIGVLEGETYTEVTIPFAPGESIVVFSDGFPDAHDEGENRFGAEPIGELLGEFQGPASAFVEQIVARADEFMGDSLQFDDMAMICLRREA